MITAIIGSSGAQIAFSDTPIVNQPSGVTVAADARIVNRPTITMALDPNAASYEAGGCTLEIFDDQGIISGYITARMAAGSDLYRQPVLLRVNEGIELHYQVGDYSRSEDMWSLRLVETAELSRADVVTPTIAREQFPSAPDASIGRAVPVIFGVVSGDYGGVRCPRVAADTFVVAAHPCLAVHSCWVGQTSPATEWTSYVTSGWTYIHARSDADYIMATVSGRVDSNNQLIVNPLRVAEALCSGSGVTITWDAQTDALAAALDQRGSRFDFAIDEPVALKTVLPEIAICAGVLWRYDQGSVRFFDPYGGDVVSVHSLAVDGWEESAEYDRLCTVADYRWRYDYDARRFLRAEVVQDGAAISVYGKAKYEADLSCVRDDRAALAAISQSMQSGRPKSVACRMMVAEYAALGLHVGSVIRINGEKPGLGGVCDYLITRVTIDQASDAVSLQMASWYGTRPETPRRWLVQASSSPGGTVSPQGISLVAHGETLGLTVSAATGYSLSHFYVDGTDVKSQLVGGTYQLGVTSGHIVQVVYAADIPKRKVVTWVAGHSGGLIEQAPHGARVYDAETYDDGAHVYGWVWPDVGWSISSFVVNGTEMKAQLVRDPAADTPDGALAYKWDVGNVHIDYDVGVSFG